MEEEKEAWYYSGLSYYKQSKYNEAELSCRRALELDDYYASAWLCLALRYLNKINFHNPKRLLKIC